MWGARLVVVGTGLLVLAACEPADGTETPTQADDLAEFDGLVESLEGDRELIVEGPAQDYAVAGSRLTWFDISAGNPVLRTLDDETGEQQRFDFAVHWPGSPGGATDNMNFALDADITVTMNTMDALSVYASDTGRPLGEVVLPAPPYGQKWWAYSADGGNVYAMLIEDGAYHLRRFAPDAGEDPGQDVLVLDDLIAPNVMGEFTTFTVSGDTLMFYEGGRLWVASLSGGKAKWTQNDEYVGSVDFTADDVVYSQGGRIFRYDVASDSREELTDAITAGYTMNATYPEPHLPTATTAFSRAGDRLYYEGTYGIFAYDLGTEEVEPVLLNRRDNSVTYRYPTAMEATGALCVKGLESESGAIGADGPTWRVAP